jgi:hypothetical protein
MNIIIIILVSLLAFVVILLVVALFVKKDYSVTRETEISKPKQIVFNYIKFLRNQDNFSKWASMDPNMKKEYRGTDGEAGFVSAWESAFKNVGKGEQEITKITEGERIDFNIHFIKPFEGRAKAFMTTVIKGEN